MNRIVRSIVVGVAALGLSLPALASTPAPTAPVQKPAVTAKVHKHKKAHRTVAQAEKKAEAKPETKAEAKPAPKPVEKAPATAPAKTPAK